MSGVEIMISIWKFSKNLDFICQYVLLKYAWRLQL